MSKEINLSFDVDVIKASGSRKETDKIKKGDWVMVGYATTYDLNVDNVQITRQSLEKAVNDLLERSTVLFDHDSKRPIGKVVETGIDDKGMLVQIVISKSEEEIWNKIKDGTLSKFSISGLIKDFSFTQPDEEGMSVMQINDIELLEVSVVSVPAIKQARSLNWYIANAIQMSEEDFAFTNSYIQKLEVIGGRLSSEDKMVLDYVIGYLKDKCKEKEEKEKDEYNFSDDPNANAPIFQFNLSSSDLIDLGEGKKFKKQLLRKGKWFHWDAPNGVLNITSDVIKNLVKNYEKKVLDHVNVPVTHTNDPLKNTGEVVELIPTDDGLDMVCEIRDDGVIDKIKNGLIQSISASIDSNYYDKENGSFVGPTLLHAALVHEPYIKGMRGFVELADGQQHNNKEIIVFEDSEFDVTKTVESIKEALTRIEAFVKEQKDNNMANENDNQNENQNTEETKIEKEEIKEEIKEETTSENVEKQENPEVAPENTEVPAEAGSEANPEGVTTPEGEGETKVEEEPKVDLSEANGIYDKYLKMGKIVPAQKSAFINLITSKSNIELADGKTSNLKQLVAEFLDSQPKIVNFEENGNELPPDPEPVTPPDELPADVKDLYCNKMHMSEADAKNAWNLAQEEAKMEAEQKGSTIFK